MQYRSKSAARVRSELQDAARRYGVWLFEAVDNILDMSYLNSLFPQLIADAVDFEFFYELKANLTRQQLGLLSRAGVRNIQPGIESLSTPVLRLMRKGITAIQNVNTLRWAHYYDVGIHWNLLHGFPGETVADYRAQDDLIRKVRHLPPPTGTSRIWMERFSPLFTERNSLPLEYLRPHESYQYIYPAGVDLDTIAYFFEYQFAGQFPDEEMDVTRDLVKAWRAAWREEQRPTLTFRAAPEFVQIQDQRDPANFGTYTFRGPLAEIYAATSDRPRSAASLKQQLQLPWPVDEVEEALDEFSARGLMMRDGTLFLSLALPATPGR